VGYHFHFVWAWQMATINCKVCKTEVNSAAKFCPKCGAKNPNNETTKLFIVFAIFFGIAVLVNVAVAFFKN
jgi:RNA polymerase subunit RPABC4/transcription elongation factor Spt4